MTPFNIVIIILFNFFLFQLPDGYSQTTPLHKKTVTSKTLDKRQTGLRVYKPEKCFNGYTLFALMPLHNTSVVMAYIYLIDMNGEIIHKWVVETAICQAQLKPDGHLLYATMPAKFSSLSDRLNHTGSNFKLGLRELDSQSNVIWYYPGAIDHDFQILKDGNVLIERKGPIQRHPRIEIISPNERKILWSWKGEEHIEELETLLGLKVRTIGQRDWAHNNTCEMLEDNPLGKKDARFRKGNILFSYSLLNIIGIIDYSTGKIVWVWGPGEIIHQHMPTMLANGNLLIFDNHRNTSKASRVIELDPLTEEIVWEYHAEPPGSFYSEMSGGALPLPNGNILITEATSNRIFEITPAGEIVWDFISTSGRITGGGSWIHIAYRYPPGYVEPLLKQIKKMKAQDKNNLAK